jgi:hypothetical protein
MKVLITQISQASCYFLPHMAKYVTQHPTLKHPQFHYIFSCSHKQAQVKIQFTFFYKL